MFRLAHAHGTLLSVCHHRRHLRSVGIDPSDALRRWDYGERRCFAGRIFLAACGTETIPVSASSGADRALRSLAAAISVRCRVRHPVEIAG
jgi:hypothetical protein